MLAVLRDVLVWKLAALVLLVSFVAYAADPLMAPAVTETTHVSFNSFLIGMAGALVGGAFQWGIVYQRMVNTERTATRAETKVDGHISDHAKGKV